MKVLEETKEQEVQRLRNGIQSILDRYPLPKERCDFIPVEVLYEIRMNLKGLL